jgi:NitT/TauT family transport system permease protein
VQQPAVPPELAEDISPTTGRVGNMAHLVVLAALLLWLVAWELAVQAGLLDPRWAPPPSNVFPQLINIFVTGFIWPYLATTVQHLLAGYLFGIVAALLLSLAGARRPWLWNSCGLFLLLVVLCPLLPLLVIVVGYFRAVDPFIMIGVAVSTSFIALWTSTLRGNGQPIDRATLLGVLPTLQMSAWIGLFVLLILETLGRTSGLGYALWRSWETFSLETLYAEGVIVALMAYMVWWIFDAIELVVLRFSR